MAHFRKQTPIPVSQQELYDWHASGGAFSRLAPPWEQIEIVEWKGGVNSQQKEPWAQFGDISQDAEVILQTKVGPIWQTMHAKHVAHKQPEMFRDVMIKGPFSHWTHDHRFVKVDEGSSILDDDIEYRLPLSPVSDWIAGGFVRKKLEKMFRFRHRRTLHDLKQKRKYNTAPKRIAVTGATGLVGSELCSFLRGLGHTVLTVSRSKADEDQKIISFDAPHMWEGLDVVVHLAGEPIADRWSAEKKLRIRNSRSQLTHRLATLLSKLDHPPELLISASAIGFYGHREEDEITEESAVGTGFLSEVCQQWENAVHPAKEKGIRCVHPRIGMVLTPKGGALKKMLLPFRMGAGGPVGSGTQWMSWISLDDLIDLFYFIINTPQLSGVINATAPNPVQNRQFGLALGKALSRPAFLPLPSFVVRLLFGEMGQALLLEGARVVPKRAQKLGFDFTHSTLEDCFQDIL